MDAKEKYAETHAEVMKDLYPLFLEDTKTWELVLACLGRLATAAFEYGQESPKSGE